MITANLGKSGSTRAFDLDSGGIYTEEENPEIALRKELFF